LAGHPIVSSVIFVTFSTQRLRIKTIVASRIISARFVNWIHFYISYTNSVSKLDFSNSDSEKPLVTASFSPWQILATSLFFVILGHKTLYNVKMDPHDMSTHQFDLLCTSTHRLYFDFLGRFYFDQNCTSTCTSRLIRNPD